MAAARSAVVFTTGRPVTGDAGGLNPVCYLGDGPASRTVVEQPGHGAVSRSAVDGPVTRVMDGGGIRCIPKRAPTRSLGRQHCLWDQGRVGLE